MRCSESGEGTEGPEGGPRELSALSSTSATRRHDPNSCAIPPPPPRIIPPPPPPQPPHIESRDVKVMNVRSITEPMYELVSAICTWGPQGQGVRGVKTMVKSVGDRQIPRLESHERG